MNYSLNDRDHGNITNYISFFIVAFLFRLKKQKNKIRMY